jgi:hypothetical protein
MPSPKRARTVSGAVVRLHEHILERILRKHSELMGCEDMILETVRSPDYVLQGHEQELLSIKHYNVTPIGGKDMIVVYREDKELIITAFLTSKADKIIKKRRVVWSRAK